MEHCSRKSVPVPYVGTKYPNSALRALLYLAQPKLTVINIALINNPKRARHLSALRARYDVEQILVQRTIP